MLPGDSVTQYYLLKFSNKNNETIKFSSQIKDGYEKLSEVMKCKVVLITTDEVLYDGLMKDMPESINYTISTVNEDDYSNGELYYSITSYLDKSVGNEYQNKNLYADFRWWIEEDDNLSDNPSTDDKFDTVVDDEQDVSTGDKSNIYMWMILFSVSVIALFNTRILRKGGKSE